jgi:4-hydroxybenzoyl-CoA thioesterase
VIVFERSIKFEEVDAAGIVFFAWYLNYAHEAMEHFFSELPGGYAGLVLERRIGLPAVHVEVAFSSPLRYGEKLRIETTVKKVGNRSAVLRYRMINARTGLLAADLAHTVVTTNLGALRSCDMPEDVRARLLLHVEPAPS